MATTASSPATIQSLAADGADGAIRLKAHPVRSKAFSTATGTRYAIASGASSGARPASRSATAATMTTRPTWSYCVPRSTSMMARDGSPMRSYPAKAVE